jgi:hypothetical protein
MKTMKRIVLTLLLCWTAAYADDSADRAQCIRDRDACDSQRCVDAMRKPQGVPGDLDPKVRCERACMRRGTPRCRNLLGDK